MVRRKKTVRKAPSKARQAVGRARKRVDSLDSEEVAFLFDRLQAEERSEKLWHEMTASSSEEGDTWVEVKEHLLAKAAVREGHERRWKFFGK